MIYVGIILAVVVALRVIWLVCVLNADFRLGRDRALRGPRRRSPPLAGAPRAAR